MQFVPLEGYIYRELRQRYDRLRYRFGPDAVGAPTPDVVRRLVDTTRPVARSVGVHAVHECIKKIGDAYEASRPTGNAEGWNQVFQTAEHAADTASRLDDERRPLPQSPRRSKRSAGYYAVPAVPAGEEDHPPAP